MRNQVKPANDAGRMRRSSVSPFPGRLRKAAGEEGSILVLTALSMTALLGSLGPAAVLGNRA